MFSILRSTCFLLLILLLGCASANKKTKLKFAVLSFQHETCTFCPGGDTETEDWLKLKPLLEGEDVFEASSYMKGFVKRAKDFGDIDLVPLRSPYGVFGGSSRSWNSTASFEYFMDLMIEDLEANMPVDGVYLSLHGAMATRGIPRPEAEIAKRIRAIVGPDVPIAGSFDLHGNEDEEFLKYADGAFVTKRFPHYDSFIQGERSANYLRQIALSKYDPTTASRKAGIISPTVVQWTGAAPPSMIMERARRWEARHNDVYVSVFLGFPWSDVPDVGAAIHVMTNDDQHLADSIADDMNEYFLRVKEEFVGQDFIMPESAADRTVAAINSGQTPVVLGDYSDRPGDATWILDALQKRSVGKVLYGGLRDERALKELEAKEAKPGDDFDMMLGGYTGEQAGKEVRITGKLRFFGPALSYEKVAVVEYGDGNMVVITPTYEQIIYPSQLKFGPIDPDDFDVFVVKSRVHFRRGFDETGYAKTIMVVDAPGPWFGTSRLDALDYKNVDINALYPYN